ncbi:MAG: DEAD/DEAH box helicase [Deltaproteobacteria bacterium]|nr:DEAD/DEAH box helicase [Deltaproteobacteria bacterium]MBW2014973.1 DEAD/DEAH box helicase [Deltaproteobacteria bacterium]MBW2321576.1 DEAD/DEAH box helicase [Deltaproteobacteria bacterium]
MRDLINKFNRQNQKGAPLHRRPSRKKGKKIQRNEDAPTASVESELKARWDVSQFKVPPAQDKTRFHDFDLPNPLLHAISNLGFKYCTPIQAKILPISLTGRDASGRAQTGTGKTAVFLITVITRMLNNPIQDKRKPGAPRILVLAPTRELVLQISEEARHLSRYTDLQTISVFGGMDYKKQKKQLSADPVDIVIATPGRLLDFQRNGDITLKKIEVLIIDEADRMLDMGFIPDMRKIIDSTPAKDKRQTLLFSATLTGEITRLASQWTRKSITVEIEPEHIAVETVDQVVYIVTTFDKFALLLNIIHRQNLKRALIFCNRRDEVRKLAKMLTRHGIKCSTLSGDIPQKKRIRRLEAFKTGKIRVLVATDVAGRGIHIEGMNHVINFMLPHDPEVYVHRIGRTGRAGATGTSVSFADEKDAFYLPAIEAFMEQKLSCIEPKAEWLTAPKPILARKKRSSRRRKNKKNIGVVS